VPPIHVIAIAGSLRKKSYNRGLIRAAVELAPEAVTIEPVEIGQLPLYDADMDGLHAPDAVQTLRAKVAAADALLIATPEYNYSVPGVLKNAIDWLSRQAGPDHPPAIQGKPAAIMGAGGRFGTVRAQAHLRYILLYNDLKLVNKPEVMVVRAWEAFDADGRLTDENIRTQVQQLVQALATWTQQLRP
jgi:chromate reductase